MEYLIVMWIGGLCIIVDGVRLCKVVDGIK